MFDDIPVHAWLLILIAIFAYPPAHYLYRHIAASPARRDITQPSEDLSWRTSARLVRSVATLGALAALAIFIFTPAAEQFARSPSFFPILLVSMGAWALYTVPRGLIAGEVQPFVRGLNETYNRQTQPKRFWASLTWNSLLGLLCIGIAYPMYEDTKDQPLKDRCYYYDRAVSPQQRIAACDTLIDRPKIADADLADALAGRATSYYRIGDYRRALMDNSNSIRLNPAQSYVRHNRALVYEALGDRPRAVADYDEAIRLDPADPDAYVNRGLIFLDSRDYEKARADFTKAHELDPQDAWALANRGLTYAWTNDHARAEADFKAASSIDPSNPVVLRGKALLAMNAGDVKIAVAHLTAALNANPDDLWSLALRSEAYRVQGEHQKALADREKLEDASRSAAAN